MSLSNTQESFPELNKLKQQHMRLQSCLQRFESIEGKINETQQAELKHKYKYFLKKYNTLVEKHRQYKQVYENISHIVEKSAPVEEEVQRITFIQMVSEETRKDLQRVLEAVQKANEEKESSQQSIEALKNELLAEKRMYFQIRKRQNELLRIREQSQFALKNAENTALMLRIRRQKQGRRNQNYAVSKMKPVRSFELEGQVQPILRKELQLIDNIKSLALREANLDQHKLLNLSLKHHDKQKETNRKIVHKQMILSVKKKQSPPQSEKDQSFQQQKQRFMLLSSQKVFEEIVRKGKIQEILALLDGQKLPLLKIYQQIKSNQTMLG